MQLSVSVFFLHLSFLLSGLMSWLEMEDKAGLGCQVLGLLLHWSLLAAFSWTALEGFHLYLLLVRVFNIYVKRYLLKLCLVGWGEWILDGRVGLLFYLNVFSHEGENLNPDKGLKKIQ